MVKKAQIFYFHQISKILPLMTTKTNQNDRDIWVKLVLSPRFEIFQKDAILAALGRIGRFRARSNLSGINQVNWWFMTKIYFFICQNLGKSPDNLYFLSKYQEKWVGHDFQPEIGRLKTGSIPSWCMGVNSWFITKIYFSHVKILEKAKTVFILGQIPRKIEQDVIFAC